LSRHDTTLRPGDLVEVRTPVEIMQTLDADGAIDYLPFMPEMLEFCGQRHLVSSRALTICFSGPGAHRGFRVGDVFTLDGVRCSGAAHDGCQKACISFWRQSWLRKRIRRSNQRSTRDNWINCDPASKSRPARKPIIVRPANCRKHPFLSRGDNDGD
jgi:hypothetical protein